MSNTLIIIPVYNAEKHIARSLMSAVNQTLKTEVWVVDNCSTDNTVKIVREYLNKYTNIKLFENKKNLGRVGNWNRCLELFEKSDYKFIKWLFSGDELFPECIELVEKAFSKDKEIAAVAFPFEFKDLKGVVNIVQDYKGNHLFGKKKMKLINIEEGGFLSTIVCNTYSKDYILGYRFNELFITKNDYDFYTFSNAKGYYLDKVLARFNVDARGTYAKAMDYITETEFVFNRAYWLEKLKKDFSEMEYNRIREKIYLEFMVRNANYYPLSTQFKLFKLILSSLPKRIVEILAAYKNNVLYGKNC